jgi:hypothetical protein
LTDYTFDRVQVDRILSGEKDFTLKPTGKITHAKVGERIGLLVEDSGLRFAEAVCVLRSQVLLTPRGITLQKTVDDGQAGYQLWRGFQAATSGAMAAGDPGDVTPLARLAARDGFGSWTDLYEYHALKTHVGLGRQVWRELIGWAQLEPAAMEAA